MLGWSNSPALSSLILGLTVLGGGDHKSYSFIMPLLCWCVLVHTSRYTGPDCRVGIYFVVGFHQILADPRRLAMFTIDLLITKCDEAMNIVYIYRHTSRLYIYIHMNLAVTFSIHGLQLSLGFH